MAQVSSEGTQEQREIRNVKQSASYPTVEAARLGTATLLRNDRIVRVAIVQNLVPPTFVEWAER
jgi:hypothetical protein